MVPLCALAALCLTASASAGQSMALPSGVPQTAWERAAQLAGLTAKERRAFEKAGGELTHLPGSINPADLGFHKD